MAAVTAGVGAVAGAIAGKGKSRQAQQWWIAGGLVAGALVGKLIGAKLDDASREKADDAAQKALKSGKVQGWESDDGTSGTVLAGAATAQSDGRVCRALTHEVKFASGERLSETAQACQANSASNTTAAATGANDVRFVQQKLADLGYSPGPVDGLMGKRTRSAIRAYQEKRGLSPVDGEVTSRLIERLKEE